MVREKLIPDLALVSAARRARETSYIVRKDLPKTITHRDAPGIYEVSSETILEIIRVVEPGVRTLLLVGHNPGMEDLAVLLVKDGDADAIGLMKENSRRMVLRSSISRLKDGSLSVGGLAVWSGSWRRDHWADRGGALSSFEKHN